MLKISNESEIMEIAKVTPIFKSGSNELLTNYGLISVFSCFSKILERLHNYLNDDNFFLITSLVSEMVIRLNMLLLNSLIVNITPPIRANIH